jgi:hypothetical protein
MWSKLAAVGGSLALVGSQANAAVPEAVTTAIAAMGTDSIVVATAFLVASIALTAFLFMKRGAR